MSFFGFGGGGGGGGGGSSTGTQTNIAREAPGVEARKLALFPLDLQRRRISLSIKQAAEGGVVAAEYQEHFGEHAYDDEGNFIGGESSEGQEAWAELYGEDEVAAVEDGSEKDSVEEASDEATAEAASTEEAGEEVASTEEAGEEAVEDEITET